MPVQPGDIIRATANMQYGVDGALKNVFHIRADNVTQILDSQMETAVALWIEAIFTCINAQISGAVAYVDIDIYNVTQDRPLITQGWPSLTVGISSNNRLPDGDAVLVSMKTAAKKRGGRKYFGGQVTTNVVANGTWISTLLSLFACVLLLVVGTQTYATIPLMPGTWGGSVLGFEPFTLSSVDVVPAYQRRRRPGTGE